MNGEPGDGLTPAQRAELLRRMQETMAADRAREEAAEAARRAEEAE